MEMKYNEGQSHSGPDYSPAAQITVSLTERDHNQYIVISTEADTAPVSDVEQSIEIPAALLPELKRALETVEAECGHGPLNVQAADSAGSVVFAHPSEEEFVRILDFYCIRWEYEPKTFPLEWGEEGNVVSSFTPDFYLPEHDLFLELTTLKQGLVTKKNRKVRRLRELYPDVNIKILYASDYRKLIEKFAASGAWSQDADVDVSGIESDEE